MTNQPPTILLLDDDVDFVAIGECVLRRGGYNVVCCHDTASAMGLLATQKVDLVITDLIMGSLDAGLAFAKEVRHDVRTKAIPILILTSVTSQKGYDLRPRNKEDLAAMNVDAYLDKPAKPQALLAKVAELLNP